MIVEHLREIFTRDLAKLKTEIALYKNENNLWQIEKQIANSAGNLCLHLIGNLNAYIGVGLAKTNYIRQRDLEFSTKHISAIELLQKIDHAAIIVETGLKNINDSQLTDEFPIIVWGKPTQTGYVLIHLATHLNYHLGQINYHRRFCDI